MSAIPLVDAGDLRSAARRTLAVRVVLGALLLGLVLAAVLVSRNPHTETIVALPPHSAAIVVLDVSASISQDTFTRIGATLSSLARSNGRYGLVAFSDEAYEALPPGTPARDLDPLVRYFTLPEQKSPGFAATFPANPWQRVFTAGTKISAGLDLAHRIAVEDRLSKPVVILVSDLDDDPEDIDPLARVLLAYQHDRIPLKIVGLNPSQQNADFFEKLSGGAPIVRAGTLGPGPEPKNHTPFPWTLLALALAVAIALAAHELWGPRLDWRTA